jgi:hypothetical protein
VVSINHGDLGKRRFSEREFPVDDAFEVLGDSFLVIDAVVGWVVFFDGLQDQLFAPQ